MQYQSSGVKIHIIRVMLIMLLILMAPFFFNTCHQSNENSEPFRDGNLLRSTEARNTSPACTEGELAQLVTDNNTFAFELYQVLKEGIENMMYSPYSISMAMAMTYAGARNNNETQIAGALLFTLPKDRFHSTFNALDLALNSRSQRNTQGEGQHFILKGANSVWGQEGYPFLSEYLDVLAINYDAGMRIVDFQANPEAARVVINDWVLEQTENKIEDLLPEGSIDIMTRLVLVNAIYFNASWAKPFDEANTQDGEFFLADGTTVTVPMMWMNERDGKNGESFKAADGQGYQAIELPYYSGALSMLIVVPDDGQFQAFEQTLDYSVIENIVTNLSQVRLILTMPKFEYQSEFGLIEGLTQMGMSDAFDPERADFSGIDGGYGGLFIAGIRHKTFISVDEEGTEAAAATGVVVGIVSAFPTKEIVINRPFIYLIRDVETGAILFIGRVLNPAG